MLDFRKKPGLIVVLTDGEETCGGSRLRRWREGPCDGRATDRARLWLAGERSLLSSLPYPHPLPDIEPEASNTIMASSVQGARCSSSSTPSAWAAHATITATGANQMDRGNETMSCVAGRPASLSARTDVKGFSGAPTNRYASFHSLS